MVFTVDGVDFTQWVDIAGYKVKTRKVRGQAQGTLLDGSTVPDVLAIKTDFSVNIVATAENSTSQIASALKKETVDIVFSDPITGVNLENSYEPEIGTISMAIDRASDGKSYWYGFSVDFTEV